MQALRIAVLLLCLGISTSVSAARYALLIGVSAYPFLKHEQQLSGPSNDVRMFRALLEREGFAPETIQSLADGVDGAALPTRDEILRALDALGTKVRAGDYVFVYFTGHGSRIPSDDRIPLRYRKADGWQELFLPRDTRRWDPNANQRALGAIADDELIDRIDAIRAKGAFVWAVFDACYSGTMVRGAPNYDGAVARGVTPAKLGVPPRALEAARRRYPLARSLVELSDRAPPTRDPDRSSPKKSGYVAFYATHPDEFTWEDFFQEGRGSVKHGIFSVALAKAIASRNANSYRQLGEFVQQQYSAANRLVPTPLYTGGANLDSPVFGTTINDRIRQWPILRSDASVSVRAGLLDDLTVGSLVAILPSPLADDRAAIGYMRVEGAKALEAQLAPVTFSGVPAPDVSRLPKLAYARLIKPGLDFGLRVLPPPPSQGRSAEKISKALAAIDPGRPGRVRIVRARVGEAYDVRLQVAGDRIWFVRAADQLRQGGPNRSPSLDMERRDFAEALTDDLCRIGKTLNLLQMANALQASDAPSNLSVTPHIERHGTHLNAPQDRVSTGDHVSVAIENVNQTIPIDVTALYVDSDYRITALNFANQGNSRLAAKSGNPSRSPSTLGFHVNADQAGDPSPPERRTFGVEHLILIAVEARSGDGSRTFNDLAGDCSEKRRGVQDDLDRLLDAAGLGSHDLQTRGGGTATTGRTQMVVSSFIVQP